MVASATGAYTVSYDASANSYTLTPNTQVVTNNNQPITFTPANTNGSDAAFQYYKITNGSTVDQLSLFKSVTTNSRLALTYVTYGVWTRSVAGSSTTDFTSRFTTFGVQTSVGNVPTTGSATFTGIADGAAAINGQAYRLAGSTGTFTANFATGGVTTSLTLLGNPDVSSDNLGTTSLGTLTGTGTIGSGTGSSSGFGSGRNTYAGSIAGVGTTSGTLNGAFFGPAATETGYGFSATGGGNSIAGVFVGKR